LGQLHKIAIIFYSIYKEHFYLILSKNYCQLTKVT